MHRGNWVAPGGMSITLLYGVTLTVKTQEKGCPVCIWDLSGLVLGTAFAAVSQPAVPGVPGTEVVTSLRLSHPGTPRGSGYSVALINKKLMSTFTCLAQQTLFFLLIDYQIQKVTHCGYYFMILFLMQKIQT